MIYKLLKALYRLSLDDANDAVHPVPYRKVGDSAEPLQIDFSDLAN